MTERMQAYLTALTQQEQMLMIIVAVTALLAAIWYVYSHGPRLLRWFAGWPFWTMLTIGYLALVAALAFCWPALEALVTNA
jgi:hypothetical protein